MFVCSFIIFSVLYDHTLKKIYEIQSSYFNFYIESENGYQAYDCMQTTEVNNVQNEQEVPLIQNSEPANDAENDYSYNGHVQEE